MPRSARTTSSFLRTRPSANNSRCTKLAIHVPRSLTPIASSGSQRLERLDDDHIGLQLKTAYSEGTTHIALSHFELLERLCALVPTPNTRRGGIGRSASGS